MMRHTEKLRTNLDKLGIEWSPCDDPYCKDRVTKWCVEPLSWTALEDVNGLWLNADTIMKHKPLTPEQAIAATIGTQTWNGENMSKQTPTDRLRELLDRRGITWTANDGEDVKETSWTYMGDLRAAFFEYDNGATNFYCDTWRFTPKQALAATIGNEPKANPRNYNPDGGPKIPNLPIGADPDWVDWVASLEHKDPSSLKETVEQFMFEVICFGGDMGPNDCGDENGTDEGMIYTNDFIDYWVRKIAQMASAKTCHEDKRCCANCDDQIAVSG